MPTQSFHLRISPENMLAYYSGQASTIRVKSDTGLWIQFPASLMRSFISNSGVNGYFQIQYNEQGKFEKVVRLS